MPEKKPCSFRLFKRNQNDECLVCFRKKSDSANFLQLFVDDDLLCNNCREKLVVFYKKLNVQKIPVFAIYEYESNFSHLLIQYKELCDEALYAVFLEPFKTKLWFKYHSYTLIPVPSTKEKLMQRGFDHIEKMFLCLNLPIVHLFEKKKSPEQKQSNYKKRQEVKDYIQLIEKVEIPQTPLLIVDDVVTSGASVTACYELLKDHPFKVEVLSISINSSNIPRKSKE